MYQEALSDYFDVHQHLIETSISTVISDVMAQCPPDPVRFMAERLHQLSSSAGPALTSARRSSAAVLFTEPANLRTPPDEAAVAAAAYAKAETARAEAKAEYAKAKTWSLCKWFESLNLTSIVAEGIRRSAKLAVEADELQFVRGLQSQEELLEYLTAGDTIAGQQVSAVLATMAEKLWKAKVILDEGVALDAAELQSKFIMEDAGKLEYAGLHTFFGGLEGRVRDGVRSPADRSDRLVTLALQFSCRSVRRIHACNRPCKLSTPSVENPTTSSRHQII